MSSNRSGVSTRAYTACLPQCPACGWQLQIPKVVAFSPAEIQAYVEKDHELICENPDCRWVSHAKVARWL